MLAINSEKELEVKINKPKKKFENDYNSSEDDQNKCYSSHNGAIIPARVRSESPNIYKIDNANTAKSVLSNNTNNRNSMSIKRPNNSLTSSKYSVQNIRRKDSLTKTFLKSLVEDKSNELSSTDR